MVYRRQKKILLCLTVIVFAIIIGGSIYASEKEQYYRSFYRADIEISLQFYYAFQEVYNVITQNNYDFDHMTSFFTSSSYRDAMQKMEDKVNERKKLYANYPVVDFSLLTSFEEDLDNLKQFTNWVLSDNFDSQFVKSYFELLGLNVDRSSSLREMNENMKNLSFPSRSDNYINPALGHTPLVTDIH